MMKGRLEKFGHENELLTGLPLFFLPVHPRQPPPAAHAELDRAALGGAGQAQGADGRPRRRRPLHQEDGHGGGELCPHRLHRGRAGDPGRRRR